MAWSTEFRQKLRGTFSVEYLLEVVRPLNDEGVGIDGWFAASDPALGGSAQVLKTPAPRLGSTGVTPQSWTYQEGAWSVMLMVPEGQLVFPGGIATGRPALQYAARALKRGALVRLYIGETGAPKGDYQPLKLGRIQSIRSTAPGLLQVEVWDLMAALRTRLAATVADADEKARLFYGSVGQQDTLTTDYTVGDGSFTISGSVTDRFLLETGGDGAIKVVGDSTTFYLTYTGATGSTISGLSGTGQFGTTASDATEYEPGPVPPPAPGNLVSSTALLEAHPLLILRSVLTSTGDGTNGARDLYPRPWGLGLPDYLLDLSSWRQLRTIIAPSAGVLAWRIIVEAEVEDPAAWIASIWNPAGIWLAVREGEIVPRAARDPNGAVLLVEGTISSADLLAGAPPYVEWFPAEVPVTYHRSRILDASGSQSGSTSNVTTLPSYEETTHDTSASTVSIANAANVRAEVRDRLAPWDHFVPEYVNVTLRGIWSTAPGDIYLLDLPEVAGRLDGTVGGYDQRPAMVVRESMDLSTNSTTLTLATLPTDLQEDSP